MYATQQDIENRYDKDTLLIVADVNNDGEIDAGTVNRALIDAGDEIDLYIGRRETLPLAVVPPILKRLAVDMALYFLSSEQGYTEEKRKRYEDAKKMLHEIATGKLSLGINNSNDEDASPVSMDVELTSEPRLFKRNSNNRIF